MHFSSACDHSVGTEGSSECTFRIYSVPPSPLPTLLIDLSSHTLQNIDIEFQFGEYVQHFYYNAPPCYYTLTNSQLRHAVNRVRLEQCANMTGRHF